MSDVVPRPASEAADALLGAALRFRTTMERQLAAIEGLPDATRDQAALELVVAADDVLAEMHRATACLPRLVDLAEAGPGLAARIARRREEMRGAAERLAGEER